MPELNADVAIIGGGLGGCAAALAACDVGQSVVLTEETDWLGGQLTSQLVPPDENPWIERFGCTARYRSLRETVRSIYRESRPLTDEARANPTLNPGGGGVSRLCCEPRVALEALERLLAPHRASGKLRLLLRHRPTAAEVDGEHVRSVMLRDEVGGGETVLRAPWFLDATETGDLLPLTGTEYLTGAESRDETGEPHAAPEPQPGNEQAITWCFAMGWDPRGIHVIEPPASYAFWREYVPQLVPPWSGRLLDWCTTHPITLQPRVQPLFREPSDPERGSWWRYRQIVSTDRYPPELAPEEATVVNWPQNDYWLRRVIDVPDTERDAAYREARELSRSLLYWMQTEAPRPDGGSGYPGLRPRPDLTGTVDGLAKYPYIRESRRIRATFTVKEQHVGVDARREMGLTAPELFEDGVGIGYYRIDLHPSTGGDNYIDIDSFPFQIPLGALVPVRMRNLLPACKNLGVTHITNGCYRLHPVEWGVGEAAGALAAFCLDRGAEAREVREDAELLADFQRTITAQGIEIVWPPEVFQR